MLPPIEKVKPNKILQILFYIKIKLRKKFEKQLAFLLGVRCSLIQDAAICWHYLNSFSK